jgi:integrase
LIEKKPKLRKSSYQTYKSKINLFCQWLDKQDLALLPINELTTDHAVLFVATLSKKSATTQKAYINDLKTVFNHFKNEKKLIAINIFEQIEKPKVIKTPQKPFSVAQRHELKKYFSENHPQIFLLVQLIFYCLIRPNEARLLLISDIDTEEGTITVRAEISKNKKTQIVALPNELKKTLLEWNIYDYPANYFLLGKGGTPNKIYWGRETLIKKHNEALRTLGYPRCYSLYSWKHTGAKSLAKSAKNIKAVQLQCRHASLDQTDQYLRDLGINDFTEELQNNYPPI